MKEPQLLELSWLLPRACSSRVLESETRTRHWIHLMLSWLKKFFFNSTVIDSRTPRHIRNHQLLCSLLMKMKGLEMDTFRRVTYQRLQSGFQDSLGPKLSPTRWMQRQSSLLRLSWFANSFPVVSMDLTEDKGPAALMVPSSLFWSTEPQVLLKGHSDFNREALFKCSKSSRLKRSIHVLSLGGSCDGSHPWVPATLMGRQRQSSWLLAVVWSPLGISGDGGSWGGRSGERQTAGSSSLSVALCFSTK